MHINMYHIIVLYISLKNHRKIYLPFPLFIHKYLRLYKWNSMHSSLQITKQ